MEMFIGGNCVVCPDEGNADGMNADGIEVIGL